MVAGKSFPVEAKRTVTLHSHTASPLIRLDGCCGHTGGQVIYGDPEGVEYSEGGTLRLVQSRFGGEYTWSCDVIAPLGRERTSPPATTNTVGDR